MDKIVGNWFLIGCLLCTTMAQARVTLRALDVRGHTLQEAVVGMPFKLEVGIEDEDGVTEKQSIDALDAFTVTGRQTHLMSINGVQTAKNIFSVHATKQGTYTIGPARATINGKEQQSEPLTLRVVAQAAQTVSHQDKEQATAAVFMRLSCDKQQAVVGEKILCTLRVYCEQEDTHIQQITEPSCEGLQTKSCRGPLVTQEILDGKSYTCAKWDWDIYPHQVGSLVIPALCGDFKIPLEDEQQGFTMYSFIMGPVVRPKRVYSNAVTLDVVPLPPSAHACQAVGEFSSYSARLKPSKAQIGEGIVLLLTLEGKGDMNALEAPQLTGMPPQLKWYESKHSVDPSAHGYEKKCFEYIVQGLEAGEWQIPSQEFTFFDTKNRTHMTLVTEPHLVSITQSSQKQSVSTPKQEDAQGQDNEIDTHSLAPLAVNGHWHAYNEPRMPWWLFFVVMVASCMFFMKAYIRACITSCMHTMRSFTRRKKSVFAHTRALIKKAQADDNAQQLYQIFVDFFAVRLGKSSGTVVAEDIEQHLHAKGSTAQDITSWQHFFITIQSVAYGNQKNISRKDLFEQAYAWLQFLEEKL